MKNKIAITALSLGTLMVVGCSEFPLYDITDKDKAVVVSKAPETISGKVVVITSAGAETKYQNAADALAASLSDKLSGNRFSGFQQVKDSVVAGQLKAQLATTDLPMDAIRKITDADYILVARLASLNVILTAPNPWDNDPGAKQVNTQFDFTWISKADDYRILFKKSVKPRVRNAVVDDDVPARSIDAAEQASKEFAYALAERYCPPQVTATRGGGHAAHINMGEDLGLKKGQWVMFYEVKDNGKSDIAEGKARIIEKDSAWVEVKNHDKVNVRKGANVRILTR